MKRPVVVSVDDGEDVDVDGGGGDDDDDGDALLTRKSALSNPTTPTKATPSSTATPSTTKDPSSYASKAGQTPTAAQPPSSDFYDIVFTNDDDDADADDDNKYASAGGRPNLLSDAIAQYQALAKQCPPWLDANSDYQNTS